MDLDTLQTYKKEFILMGILLVVVVALLIASFVGNLTSQGVNQAGSISELTFKDNKIDPNTQAAQNGAKAVDLLKPSLPFRQELTASTGTKITYTVSTNSPYFVHVELFPDLLLTPVNSSLLPKQILEFRETAQNIFSWAQSKGVNQSDLLINWGSYSYEQTNAEAWIKVSTTYPEVVKSGNTYQFK